MTVDQGGTVVQRDDYYPFGLTFNHWNEPSVADENQYKFNGNEVQKEIPNVADFNARFYDNSLGRFMNIDPLADHPKQFDQSPYQFSWNNPILLNDPTGEFPCPQCPAFFTGLAMKAKAWFDNVSGASQRLVSGTSGNVPQDVPMSSQERSLRKVATAQDATTVGNAVVDVAEGTAEAINTIPGVDVIGDPILSAYFALKGDVESSASYAAASVVPGASGAAIKFGLKEGGTFLLTSVVKNDSKILKLAKESFGKNGALRKEVNGLIKKLSDGNMNPGIDTKHVVGDIYESRSKNGGRVYFKNTDGGAEIVGYSNKHNQQQVIN